jgi:putative spermidine/putrescine transport system ATP-binding protein
MSDRPRAAADVRLERVEKSFDGRTRVVDRIDLAVEPGEFFALLGPSGCGKTTTLRMIAGFEEPDAGRILIAGDDVTHMPVHRRDLGMIFQSYALFPHRTVAENVAFGLRMRRVGKDEMRVRVGQALRQVALEGYEDRRPAQLSGGQQQRVALARAIVIRPRVLLCDEPLAALDRKLRQNMQFELKQLQQQLGVTTIFVTHDQEEAMTISDRIAVMDAGRIEQVGTSQEIYDRPKTRFVSEFIGEINLFTGEWREGLFIWKGKSLPVPPVVAGFGKATIAIRPERIRLKEPDKAVLRGRVQTSTFVSGRMIYRIALDDGFELTVKEAETASIREIATSVGVNWTPSDVVVLSDSAQEGRTVDARSGA